MFEDETCYLALCIVGSICTGFKFGVLSGIAVFCFSLAYLFSKGIK